MTAIASPEMKDSGIGWVGEIPARWTNIQLKRIAGIQTGITLGKRYGDLRLVRRPYIRVANVQDGYLDLDEITTIDLPPEDVPRYELQSGDVLMTEGGDFDKLGRGYVWEGQIDGCLHQNHVFAVRPKRTILLSRFLAALMTSAHGKHYFTSTSQQTTNLASTNSTKIGSFPILLPPLSEQDQIISFLDRKTAQIDTLIAKRQRLIELLQEKRQALISHAVTKGLDPNLPMKDSGVEWLGEIPQHWEVKPLGAMVNVFGGSTPRKDNAAFWTGGDVPWVSPKDMKRWEIDNSEDHITTAAVVESGISLIPPPAVLLVVRGMILVRDVPVSITTAPITINQDMKALVTRVGCSAEFLGFLLRAIRQAIFALVEESGHGTRCLRTELWRKLPLPIPPRPDQDAICAAVRAEIEQSTCVEHRLTDQITKLEEYRQTLISAAVTGKIDVTKEAHE